MNGLGMQICLLTPSATGSWPKMAKSCDFPKHGHIRDSQYPFESGGGWAFSCFTNTSLCILCLLCIAYMMFLTFLSLLLISNRRYLLLLVCRNALRCWFFFLLLTPYGLFLLFTACMNAVRRMQSQTGSGGRLEIQDLEHALSFVQPSAMREVAIEVPQVCIMTNFEIINKQYSYLQINYKSYGIDQISIIHICVQQPLRFLLNEERDIMKLSLKQTFDYKCVHCIQYNIFQY